MYGYIAVSRGTPGGGSIRREALHPTTVRRCAWQENRVAPRRCVAKTWLRRRGLLERPQLGCRADRDQHISAGEGYFCARIDDHALAFLDGEHIHIGHPVPYLAHRQAGERRA